MGNRLGIVAGFLTVFLVLVVLLPPVASESTEQEVIHKEITIQSDGSITLDYLCDNGTYVFDTNPDVPISRNLFGDTYTLTDDLYGHLVIEKSGITIDGAGHKLILEGYSSFAVSTKTRHSGPSDGSVANRIIIKNLKIPNFGYGIELAGSNSAILNVTLINGHHYSAKAIWDSGSRNVIQNCRIVNTLGSGIYYAGNGGLIADNYIADNGEAGIEFRSTETMLRNNVLSNNLQAFGFEINNLPANSSVIDASNIVDGNPVCCWVNENGKTVPSGVSYVLLSNCSNIIVKDMSLISSQGSFNSSGIYLYNSCNIQIRDNLLQTGRGIYLATSCYNVDITGNYLGAGVTIYSSANVNVTSNRVETKGIFMYGSTGCVFSKNIIIQCDIGLNLQDANNNTFTQNKLSDCRLGVNLFSSDDNTFGGNNFYQNTQNVAEQHSALVWPLTQVYNSINNQWIGNYWSNYNGVDKNYDGVGDTAHVVYEDKMDFSPLISPATIADVTFPQLQVTPNPTQIQSSPINNQDDDSIQPIWIVAALAVVVVILAVIFILHRRRHP